ncbi:MAG: hypothetical protein OXI74_14270, partial [Rhodospirillaceae bacterium]|nr:hypothetical protein [Rhodospirillaceae bacterium]
MAVYVRAPSPPVAAGTVKAVIAWLAVPFMCTMSTVSSISWPVYPRVVSGLVSVVSVSVQFAP